MKHRPLAPVITAALALLLAAAVLAVYLLAPVAEARGWPLAGTLTAARDGLDGLRQWLAARVGA